MRNRCDPLQDTTGDLAGHLEALQFRGASNRPLLLSFAHSFGMSTLEFFHTLVLLERFYSQPVGSEFLVGTMLAVFQISHKLLIDHVLCAEVVADIVMVEGAALSVASLRCYEEHVFARLLALPANALMISLEQSCATGRWLYEQSAGPMWFKPFGSQTSVEALEYFTTDGCVWVVRPGEPNPNEFEWPTQSALGALDLEQPDTDQAIRLGRPARSPKVCPQGSSALSAQLCGQVSVTRMSVDTRMSVGARWAREIVPLTRSFARRHEQRLVHSRIQPLAQSPRTRASRASSATVHLRSKSPHLIRAASSPSLLQYVCPTGCSMAGFTRALSAC